MSISWQLDAVPAPRLLVLPPDAASLDEAHAAIELWEHYRGRRLDLTQRLAVEVMMAETAGGSWAAQTTGRELPRQEGKGDEIEVVELWGLVQRDESILHTIHDAVLLATQAQERLLSVLEGHADLRRLVKRAWRGTGQQMVELRQGGVIWYRTRTGAGGRGVDQVDRVVIDEAQHATEEQIAAVSPTMQQSANPQMNVMGTGGLAGRSAWWWGIRRRALESEPGPFGYVGHTAEVLSLGEDGRVVQELVDASDRSLWESCCPSVLAGRGRGMDGLEEEFRVLGPESFAREHLCVWDPPPTGDLAAVKLPTDRWDATKIYRRRDVVPGGIGLAFAVSKDGARSSIAVAAGDLRAPYFELIDDRAATGWLPDELVRLVQRWKPLAVGCNPAGPAAGVVASVLQAFREAGIDDGLLKLLSAGDYRAACGGFFLDVVEGRAEHPAEGQGPLDLAAGDASERMLAGGWVWEQRQATVPIVSLEAVTVARFLLPTEPVAPPAEVDFVVV